MCFKVTYDLLHIRLIVIPYSSPHNEIYSGDFREEASTSNNPVNIQVKFIILGHIV